MNPPISLRGSASNHPGWPARLDLGEVVLRSLERSDATAWQQVRARNGAWLGPWDATVPPSLAGVDERPGSYAQVVRVCRRLAVEGRALPFVIEVGGEFAGMVTVNNIVRGSAQFASIGYWIDQAVAGRGIVPLAVAAVIDHCFTTAGLHRVEICIRPENSNSLRVVEKLGLHEVGFAPRFLHIDGAWRDHRIFAVTREERPDGMLRTLQSHE